MTSGADHLTGNLEHWELVYWSSSTNLQHTDVETVSHQSVQAAESVKNVGFEKTLPCHAEVRHLHLIVPRNKTVPGSLYNTEEIMHYLDGDTKMCRTKFLYVALPDLCEGSWNSPGKPSPH